LLKADTRRNYKLPLGGGSYSYSLILSREKKKWTSSAVCYKEYRRKGVEEDNG